MEKDAASKLSKHSNEFNKKEVKILYFILFSWSRLQSNYLQVLKVGKNVYVAIGYGLANSIMLEGEEGVVIIDTLESCEVAREVRAAFEEVRAFLDNFSSEHL